MYESGPVKQKDKVSTNAGSQCGILNPDPDLGEDALQQSLPTPQKS